jgi:hypothetical protein
VILKFIKFDLENRTLEAQWFEQVLGADGEVVSSQSCRCENFSKEQRAEFLAEVGDSPAYVAVLDALGW